MNTRFAVLEEDLVTVDNRIVVWRTCMVYTPDAVGVEIVKVGVLVRLLVLETVTKLIEEGGVADRRHIADDTDNGVILL